MPAAVLRACQEEIWSALGGQGVRRDDPATWREPVVRVDCPESEAFAAAGTQPGLWEAFDQLIGAGRWWRRRGVGGTVPVRFPSAADPGDAGWHVEASYDGDAGLPWAGDVFLCHPFLVHAVSWPHAGRQPRIIAQPAVALHGEFPLSPPLSPVELGMTAAGHYAAFVDLLVVGGSGFLGLEIVRQARRAGHRVTATFHASAPPAGGADWRPLDIRRREEVAELTRQVRPAAVVNAAYRQHEWAATADGGAHVALAAAAAGARLVHVSSDAVFSGAAPRYDETCPPDPVSPYGAAKAAAETAVRGIAPDAVIARTSLIIGGGGSKHEQLVRLLAAAPGDGVLFADEVRCPVHVADLAAALLELAGGAHAGTCHTAGTDPVSRYELGLLIAARDGLDPAALRPGRRAAAGPAGPLDVRLDSSATQARLTVRLRGAREFLAPGNGAGETSPR
ncbi:MAG TPA: sugar nucleotide-binding protein [Trebonia sp.]